MASKDNQFGRYRLIGIMASGGMARLYLAVMTGVDSFARVVALKRVLPQFGRSREFVRMFVNEGQLAARLDHPNIVRIYELGEIDGQYFISMEYLPGEDLAQILRRCRKLARHVPTNVAAAIGQSVAEALQYAHDLADDNDRRLGLVHRDVSLSNVLVTYHGVTKLADFGIAKATQSSGAATQAGVFKGKFAYASPEQVAGKELDARTDIFALGIVLWETLALKRLFKRANDAATISAVEKAEVPSLRTIRPEIPVEIDNIVLKALARRRRDRFQTAQELSDALEEAQRSVIGRATAKDLREWLEDLFGVETSKLKQRIAQGRGLENLADAEGVLPAYQARLRLKPVTAVDSVPSDGGEDGDFSPAQKPETSDTPEPKVFDSAPKSRSSEPRFSSSFGASFVPASSFERTPSVLQSSPRVAWSIDDPDGNEATRLMGDVAPPPVPPISVFTDSDWRHPGSGSQSVRQDLAGFAQPRVSRGGFAIGMGIGALMLAGVIAVLLGRASAEKNPSIGLGQGELAVSSVPAPAEIFIDGEATGLVTPAVIRSLPTDRRVRLRVEKDGYSSEEIDVHLEPERRVERMVTLERIGIVRFTGVPEDALLFVDDTPIDHFEPYDLDPGDHELRVERGGKVLHSERFVVRPGEQQKSIDARE
jgi:serine/threonine-protein kinase